MVRMPAPRLSLLALSAAVFGCLQDGETPAASGDALHQCSGSAAYDEAAFRALLAEEDGAYCGPDVTADLGVRASLLVPVGGAGADDGRVRLRTAVLDQGCRLVAERTTEAEVSAGATRTTFLLWDGTDAEGHAMPSGEYFVNTEVTAADGGTDTAYQKIGYLRPGACP